MDANKIHLEPTWKKALLPEFEAEYMVALREFLKREAGAGKQIFPKGAEIFHALDLTPLPKVEVVILGQDPYHGAGQAHGLSFSVRDGVRFPPSLRNIFKELHEDQGLPIPKTGNLTPWAEQGVLLLNSVLTVEEGAAASHRKRGWETFTDRIIQLLSDREDPIVFVLWGAFAQSKIPMIRVPPHAILKSAHPSPLSAHNGFLGSKPFSQANKILRSWGKKEIDWRLPS
jgi:uracil-DNA glycosylase